MNSPLDAFPSEKAGTGPTHEMTDAPAGEPCDERQAVARVAPSTATDRTRSALMAARVRVGTVCARIATNWRTIGRRSFVRREWPTLASVRPPSDRISVVATAALTSVGVSLLTMWTWSQGPAPGPAIASASNPNRLTDAMVAQPMPVTAITPALSHARRALGVTGSVATRGGGEDVVRAGVADGDSRLVVITRPEGARVTIDGVGWGATPLTVRHLPPGSKHVRVTMSGYRSEERVVGADQAQAATLRIALRELPPLRASR